MTRWIATAFFVGLFFAVLWFWPVFAHAEVGRASWYGPDFHGHRTASGEIYNQWGATCAHRHMKFGTHVRVTNLGNGRSAVCRITDRGPFVRGRVIDVSRAVAERLGMIHSGTARVTVEIAR